VSQTQMIRRQNKPTSPGRVNGSLVTPSASTSRDNSHVNEVLNASANLFHAPGYDQG
jgi:hypothetical protein